MGRTATLGNTRITPHIQCIKCGEVKPRDQFSAYRRGELSYRVTRCRTCDAGKKRARYASDAEFREKHKRYSREQKKRNPNAHREQDRLTPHLKRHYGLTVDQLYSLEERQDFGCAICGDDSVRLCVDHRHSDGKVRGLLCDSCNTGIGHFGESLALLSSAAKYLSTHT